MKKNLKIFLVIGIGLLSTILFFYFFKEGNKKSDNGKELITNFAEGITLIEKSGEKILIDENEKFELKIKNNWNLTKPANILEIIIEEDDYYGEAQKSFFIFKNDLFKNSLTEDVEKWTAAQNNICPKCYTIEEYKNLNGLKLAVVRDNVAINDQKFILFIQNGYLYGISTVNMNFEEINLIIKDIKFLE